MTYLTLDPPRKNLKIYKKERSFNWSGFTPKTHEYYEIITAGDTVWTDWGSSNSNVGTVFLADSTTSGTGTGVARSVFQQTTTSWEVVSGSVVDYTPPSGSTSVVYEFNSVYGYRTYRNGFEIKLQYGADIDNLADIASGNYKNGEGQTNSTNSNQGSEAIQLRYIVPAWSGSKTLALLCKSEDTDSSRSCLINTTTPNNAELTDALHYNPFIIIYSI